MSASITGPLQRGGNGKRKNSSHVHLGQVEQAASGVALQVPDGEELTIVGDLHPALLYGEARRLIQLRVFPPGD